jgi:hypothetical protein
MALNIPILAVPNQNIVVVLNKQNCIINLLTRGNRVYFDVLLDNNPIILGRQLSITAVLPYKYIQNIFNGNFIILNNDGNLDTLPDYRLFGISQSLIYYTEADL